MGEGLQMTLATLDELQSPALARIDADGYTIVEDAIEPELVVAAARHDPAARARARTSSRRGPRPKGTRRGACTTCWPRIPCSRRCRCTRACCRSSSALLDRGCLLSGMTAIDIGPGEHAQPMHGDDIVMSRHLAAPARADDGHEHVGARPTSPPTTAARGSCPDRTGSRVRPTSPARSTASRCARSRCRPAR